MRRTIDQAQWTKAYLAEIERYRDLLPDRTLGSIYFGGGTPSLMEPETVSQIMDAVRSAWRVSNQLEVTLEANPSSVEAQRFAGYRDIGVNRVSMGFQALNNDDLRRLGRLHSVEESLAALDIARNTFDRISFDLIYGRQHQSLSEWEQELSQALAFEPQHLSLYQLTIEDGTAFGDRFHRGILGGLPDEDLGADMFHVTQSMCDAAGLPAYEVSNHAKPKDLSRHNLVYWKGGDWIGIGPGAHGRLTIDGTRYATDTELSPEKWLKAVGSGTGDRCFDKISAKASAREKLMMGLRLNSGVRLTDIGAAAMDSQSIRELKDTGHLKETDGHLATTEIGRPLLNYILREIIT